MSKRKKFIIYILIFIIATSFFFFFREYRRPGADSGEIVLFARAPRLMYYYRSPLTVFLHQIAFKMLSPFGMKVEDVISLLSSIAGGLFVLVLLSFSRSFIFLLFNLFAGVMFIFLGHIEHYAWVNMTLAFYFLLSKKYVVEQFSIVILAVVFCIACLFHMLAVFYFPTLLYLFLSPRKKNGKICLSLPSKKETEKFIIVLIVFLLLLTFIPLVMQTRGLDNNMKRLVPLFKNPDPKRYYFTMFSIEHFKLLFYFYLMASPLGFLLLVMLIRRIRTPFHKYMLLAVGCGVFWEFIWHPDMGRLDWDLFSNFAIPLNILVGILLVDKNEKGYKENVKENT